MVDCWTFPHLELREKVKINNKKYCWLYPQEKAKILKNITPNFEKYKTSLYTNCDYILEHKTQQQILMLDRLFHYHYKLTKNELSAQAALLNQMWPLSQRYIILTKSIVCFKPYPEVVSAPMEERILCDFEKLRIKLKASICIITQSMDIIQEAIAELHRLCSQLDYTVESPFLVGTWYQRPLSQIRNLQEDLFEFFYEDLCTIKRYAPLVTPGDSYAIEDYIALLKALQGDRDYLWFSAEDCHCKNAENADCIKPHQPCRLDGTLIPNTPKSIKNQKSTN